MTVNLSMFEPFVRIMQRGKKNLTRSLILVPLASVWILAVVYQSCNGPGQSAEDPILTSPLEVVQGDYLGDQNCATCHTKEYEEWQGSHHDWAMAEAHDSTVLGDFENATFEANGIKTNFYRKDSEFWVRTQGVNGKDGEFKVLYTFGVEPLQQYLIGFPGGKLQALRVTWDTDKKQWFNLNPDLDIAPREWLHWTRGAMNWNNMCASCHSTNLKENFSSNSDTYSTTFSVINVSCEACHGAGKDHVNYLESGEYEEGKRVKGSFMHSIVGDSSTLQVDLCAPCHSRRSRVSGDYKLEDHYMDHYLPQVLREGLYHSDGQILDEVYVYGSFVQSKMYANGIKCSDCHNPHTTKLKAIGNALCLQCHEPKYNSPDHHFHPVKSDGSSCINCHMPGKYYMVNDFRRDHSFRVPRPDQSLKFDTPNSCNGCHTDQTIEWAAEAVVQWYGPERAFHFSDVLSPAHEDPENQEEQLIELLDNQSQPFIARATAVEYLGRIPSEKATLRLIAALGDPEPLVRATAINQLTVLPPQHRFEMFTPLLNDTIRAVRVAAANGLAEVPLNQMDSSYRDAYQNAVNEFLASLNVRSGFASGQLMLGQYLDRSGQMPNAEKAYLRALEIDSLFNPARVNLAGLYNRQRRNAEAMDLYKVVLELEPDYGYGYYSMGLLLAEESRLEEAVVFLEKGAKMEQTNSRIFYNWALALNQLQRFEEAELAFKQGLDTQPDSEPLRYALAVFLLQQKRIEEASDEIDQLLERNPEVPDYEQLKLAIDQQRPN